MGIMFDTVNSWLEASRGVVLKSHLKSILQDVDETFKENGTSYLTGNLGGLRVVYSNLGVSVKGSFSKWYLGDNIQALTRGDMKRATEKLSDTLHLPMNKAKVGRIDLAKNLLMEFKPAVYYPYLGEARHYQRLVQPKSVYYVNGLRTKLFYDKIAECKKKGVVVPQILSNDNLLRYELRFIGKLPKQFNCAEVLLENLHDEKFYMAILDRWKAEYQAIKKINNFQTFGMNMIQGKKQLQQQGILLFIEQRGGLLNVLNEIEEAQKKGELTRKQAFDLKAECREASQSVIFTTKSDLIVELDGKINSAINLYR